MSISSSSVSYSSSTFTVSPLSSAVLSGGEESARLPVALTRWLRAQVLYKAVVTLAIVTSCVGTTVSSKAQGTSLQRVLGASVDGKFDSILRNEAATVGSTAFQTANLTSMYFSGVTVSSVSITHPSTKKRSSDITIPVTVPIGAVALLCCLCCCCFRKKTRSSGRQAYSHEPVGQDIVPEPVPPSLPIAVPVNAVPPLPIPDPVHAPSAPPIPYNYREVLARAMDTGEVCHIPYTQLSEWTNYFETIVGRGKFGEVFLCRVKLSPLHPRDTKLALKRMISQSAANDANVVGINLLASHDMEVRVLSNFKHPNIIKLYAHSKDGPQLCLLFELAERGDLRKALESDGLASDLHWKRRIRVAIGVASALNYLHCHKPGSPAYHRDVKCANVVLTADWTAKLIDCGLAKYVDPVEEAQRREQRHVSRSGISSVGTPGYTCSRYSQTGIYEPKSEVYSLGIVLLELLTGRLQGARNLDEVVYFEDIYDVNTSIPADERAGDWDPQCVEKMNNLCKRCALVPYRDRLGSMGEVVRVLKEIEESHCVVEVVGVHVNMDELLADYNRLRRQQSEPPPAPIRTECCICFELVENCLGVKCRSPGAHFYCHSCFGDQTLSQTSANSRGKFYENECKVVCAYCLQKFSEADVASVCTAEIYAVYRGACNDFLEAQICRREQERHARVVEQLQREIAAGVASNLEASVNRKKLHIIENILTLKCPRCATAILDFEGCFAVTCGNCNCGFCGWCLEDCGADAHAHVKQCPQSLHRGSYYGSQEEFNQVHSANRGNRIREYLRWVDDRREREMLVEQITPYLAGLGIASPS